MTSYYVVSALDKAGHLDLRLQVRPAHAVYVKANTPGIVKLAGPYLNPQGEMIGSMLIIAVRSQEDAERFIAEDPYSKAGLFAEVRVLPWKPLIGQLPD